MHWMTEAGMFFEMKGPVWDTLRDLQERLDDSGFDYVVIGGLALNAHGYRRQTVDIDVVLRPGDFNKFKETLGSSVYKPATGAPRRFVDPKSEVTIDFLIAGEIAGNRRKNSVIRFPGPEEAETHGDLRTVSLARLIELKLVTWRFKDWGDVVALIRIHQLGEAFADELDPTVRGAYLQCYDQRVEEDRYDPQIHDAPPE